MWKSKKQVTCICTLILGSLLMFGCSGGQSAGNNTSNQTANEYHTDTQALTEAAQTEAAPIITSDISLSEAALTDTWDDTAATHIVLNGTSADIDGDGAAADGGNITISSAGTYVVNGTLSEGQFFIDAGDEDTVQIILNGVDIICSDNAPIYGANADEIVLTIADGSENTITDGSAYTFSSADEDEPDAAIFSHDDLVINGSGTLTVNGNYQKGIRSKDDLTITNGNIHVTAVDDGISGKDGLIIIGGSFVIDAGEDALKSSNDEDSDKGDLHITGGSFSINAGDDAIHAEKNLIIDGGTIQIESSTEALEGMTVTVNGGDINLVSSDDGINAAGTGMAEDATAAVTTVTESSAAEAPSGGGMPGFGGGMGEATDYNYIRITGGNIIVDAGGDGIDSNGNLYVDGGAVIIYGPTNDGNGPLDYAGTFEITGGTFIAAGSSGMAQSTSSSSTQASLMVYFNSEQQAGKTFELSNESGAVIASVTPAKSYQCILVSSPDMTVGSTYIIKSDGNELSRVTPDSIAASVSEDGTSVQGGRMSGRDQGGIRPDNSDMEPPANGAMPERPTMEPFFSFNRIPSSSICFSRKYV